MTATTNAIWPSIPFSSLTSASQRKVFAMADALREGDCLPLVPYFGNGAKTWAQNLMAAVSERPTLASEYWDALQRIPFAAAFVLDAHGTEAA